MRISASTYYIALNQLLHYYWHLNRWKKVKLIILQAYIPYKELFQIQHQEILYDLSI